MAAVYFAVSQTNGWSKKWGSQYFLNISVDLHFFNSICFWTTRLAILCRSRFISWNGKWRPTDFRTSRIQNLFRFYYSVVSFAIAERVYRMVWERGSTSLHRVSDRTKVAIHQVKMRIDWWGKVSSRTSVERGLCDTTKTRLNYRSLLSSRYKESNLLIGFGRIFVKVECTSCFLTSKSARCMEYIQMSKSANIDGTSSWS